MPDDIKPDRQPNWQPEQMETDDDAHEPDRPSRREISGGLRGGGGPTWNKGSERFDHEEPVPESELKESEEGPWGTADAAERRAREMAHRES